MTDSVKIEYTLDIKCHLRFILGFFFEMFDLFLVEHRKLIQRLETEPAEEFLCRAKQQRSSGRVKPPRLLYESIFHKFIHCVV